MKAEKDIKGFRKVSPWTLATLLLAISMAVPWTALAYVGTDKPDYSPGQAVTISGDNSNFEPGAGYVPGETVVVQVYGPNDYAAACLVPDPQNPGQGLPVVVAGDGTWSCQVTLWDDPRAIGDYTFIATGQNVSESGTFTDGVVDVDINSPTGGAWVTVTSLPATIPVNFTYQATMFGDTTGEVWVIGTGAYGSAGLDNNFGLPATTSINATIPAGITNGYYNVKATVTNNWGSPWPYSSSQSDEQSGAVKVCVPVSVTTQPTDQTVVYGNDATFTVAATNYVAIQWYTQNRDGPGWLPIPGGTGPTLTVPNPPVAMGPFQYYAALDTGCGTEAYSDAANLVVTPADATCTVSGYSVPYDGQEHTATGTCTGVLGEDVSSGLRYWDHYVNIPGGDVDWEFSSPNYASQSGIVPVTITPADATCTVTGYSGPYDGQDHFGTGTCTGVQGEDLSDGLFIYGFYSFVPGGPVHWDFAHYNYASQQGDTQTTITPADATCTVSGYAVVYDGQYHVPTGTCTGVRGEDLSSYLNLNWGVRDYPGGDVYWTFGPAPNYAEQSGLVNITIWPTDATCTVNGYSGVYDGAYHTATGTCTGLGGVDLSSGLSFGLIFRDVPGGTAHWTFNPFPYNYGYQHGDVQVTITPADATCTVSGYTGVYDGAAHGATGSCTGLNGEVLAGLDLGGEFSDAPGGAANWTFTDVTGNYASQSGSVPIVIASAGATCAVSGYSGVYDGAAHGATGSCTGLNAEVLAGLDLGSEFIDAPGGTASWTFTNANYVPQSGSVAIAITPAGAACTVDGYSGVYDGAAHGATGSCTGLNGEALAGLDLVGQFTDVPGGTANWTFTDVTGNYGDRAGSVEIVIDRANPACTVTPYDTIYDAQPHTAAGGCLGVLGEELAGLDLSGTAHTAAGDYPADPWTFADGTGNYNSAGATVADRIAKAGADCQVVGYSGIYDGFPHGASGSCSGVGGESPGTLDLGSAFADVPGGTAHWVFTGNANYLDGSGSVSINVTPADAYCGVAGWSGTYDGLAHGASGGCYGVSGEELDGLALGDSFTNVPGGMAHWTFVHGNYSPEEWDVSIAIAQAQLTVTADDQTKAFGEQDPELTYSISAGSLISGDTFSGALTRDPGEEVGTYAIRQGTLALSDNYALTFVGAELTITASNTAPVANPGGPYLGPVNTAIAFDGSLSSDPDGDPLTHAWTFGDGGTATGATPAHSYAAAGVYNVCLTVNDGTVDSPAACTLAVVYDPSAGFVTGGGWIDSPAGAYVPDPALAGRATFGFVAKYQKGAQVPIGTTEFQFDVAGFGFDSDTYEWLVVNQGGTNAQFKGSGTVNGGLDPNGNAYKFVIWAGDGSPDTFRIRIWWEAGGVENPVYDNGTAQPIGAGNIVIHTK